MFNEMIDNTTEGVIAQKNETILDVLKKNLIISEATDLACFLRQGVAERMHMIVKPGEETLYIDGKPLITFYSPEIKMLRNDLGNTTYGITQKYKDWGTDKTTEAGAKIELQELECKK